MTYGEVIKTIWRSDQKRSITIVKRGALFTYDESGEQFDLGEAFWGPTGGGGLFQTADDAETAAALEIPWLRDQNSN